MKTEDGERLTRRKAEIAAFLFLALLLAPALAVAGIGGYGLFIWLVQ